MISTRLQRMKYVVCDFFTANVAMLVFDIARYFILQQWNQGYPNLENFLLSTNLLWEQAIIPPILLVIYYFSGYYNLPFQKSRLQELFTTIISCILYTLLIYFALLTNDQVQLRSTNYELLMSLFSIFFVFTYIGRISITSHCIRQMKKKHWSINTLIIGNSDKAHQMAKTLSDKKASKGYNIVGFVDIPGENNAMGSTQSISIDHIEEMCAKHKVATIIIAPENEQESTTLSLLYRLFPLNIPIKISPDTLSLLTSPIRLQNIYEEPLIDISSADISEATKNIKRLLDIIMSLTALIILAVPMLIVALIIRLDSKGGIFYSQERIGYRQKPFYIRKFRTMRVDAESNGPQLSSENDSRITRVGRVLRKYRIDELPQFWNVLIGEMSMVGPRPERAFFIRQIVKKAPYYTLIHQVRPGITSWGMVKYGYAQNVDEMILRLRYDLIYLTNISIMVDLKIIIYTVKTVFTGRGM